MKTDTKNTMDIKRNMARRVAQIIARNGDKRKERVIKLVFNAILM